ncbi:PREDICTED: smoothelin-like protein 1 [Condylura cristata]|uniref:smoothelin-like protein 1 n=1 Tax=Condylura cristata TaxID=143302 RepID=UPI0003343C8F|nr:PREDICTED: smoothelin-like protein 1 [Condylura cristata]
MEPKEGKPAEDGAAVSPPKETLGEQGGAAEEEAQGSEGRTDEERPAEGAGKQDRAPAKDVISADSPGEANGLEEVRVDAKEQAELQKQDGGKEEATVAPPEVTDRKEEAKSEAKGAEEKETSVAVSEKQKAEEKEAQPGSQDKTDRSEEAKAEPKVKAEAREADGNGEAARASQEGRSMVEEPQVEASPAGADEVTEGPPDTDSKEEPRSAGPHEEQDQGVEREAEGRTPGTPSSPEEWPESPTEEGICLSPGGLSPDAAASGESSPSASESSPSDVPQTPTEPPPAQEKKKEKAPPERRVSAPARPRGTRAQNRKAIVDKFGGAASGPTALFRNTKAAGAAIGSVKSMLLEWCRAMTRRPQHVDIQNFSSSWSSGMAFCALIHKFFPDAFDYAALDPTQRRHNFTLAFDTAENLADCAQLLEVDDMVRLAVPDSKCVYTYIQELYRSLVQKGLVKTKKK